MTVALQFQKNIQMLDVLYNELQKSLSSFILNVINRNTILFVECETQPTNEQMVIIEQIVNDFDDNLYSGLGQDKIVSLLSTVKDFENINYWTMVCKWQHQGSYVEEIKKIVVSFSIASNDIDGILRVRLYDSTNNKIIASLQKEHSNSTQDVLIAIDNAEMSLLPATLEIHVKATSGKDILTIQNITAFYNL
jgi:hypothetical protein